MLNWDQWQTALAVYRGGTYADAAKALHIDASTVGRRLKLLERRLGYSLFLRRDGRLFPSSQCETLLSHIETASESLRLAEQRCASQEPGAVWRELRITAPPFLVRSALAPALASLAQTERLRLELMGTGSTVSLTRREADIALRIEDQAHNLVSDNSMVDAEVVGELEYATYVASGADPAALPWAGLIDEYVRTSGTQTMLALAADKGIQYRAYHFDSLLEIAASGVARALLPCMLADEDTRLQRVGESVLSQQLWMLSHHQDKGVSHVESTREWIRKTLRYALAQNA